MLYNKVMKSGTVKISSLNNKKVSHEYKYFVDDLKINMRDYSVSFLYAEILKVIILKIIISLN